MEGKPSGRDPLREQDDGDFKGEEDGEGPVAGA
jgi:hypothetical protein